MGILHIFHTTSVLVGIIEFPTLMNEWKLSHFLILICLPLSLFVASALIFPVSETYEKETFMESFEENGIASKYFLCF